MHEYREEFGEGMRDVRNALVKIDPNYGEMQDIGELVRFGTRASSSDQFSEIETAHLESWITRGQHVLQRSYTINESMLPRSHAPCWISRSTLIGTRQQPTSMISTQSLTTRRSSVTLMRVSSRPLPTKLVITNLISSTSVGRLITTSGTTAYSPWIGGTRSSRR